MADISSVDPANIGASVSGFLPSSGTVFTIIFWVLGVLVIGGLIGGITYYFVNQARYKIKIRVFSDVAGKPEQTYFDRARVVNLGQSGENCWYLRGMKRQIPPGTKSMAKNEFWYYIKEDGDLINIGLENMNHKLKLMGINFTNPAMRYARIALQRNMKDRYQKVTFMDKYGTVLIFTIHIIIVSIMFVWILKEVNSILPVLKTAIADAGELLKDSRAILESANAVKNTAALVPV